MDHEVLRLILTFSLTGNSERLAGVQGAAMSPRVAGTRPATSGMEALGPSPSNRPGLAVPLSRQPADERVLLTDDNRATIPSAAQSVSLW
jgi:hypothetical protein